MQCWPVSNATFRLRHCISRITLRRLKHCSCVGQNCSKSHASTPRFTAATASVADHFAIPESFYAEGVRRYGFHGLSYEYVAGRLRDIAPAVAKGRVIVAHLGSGASMCALDNGRSVESTMGFTALDGLPMGTRPGQIDPGVIIVFYCRKGNESGGTRSVTLPGERPQRTVRYQ